MVCAVGLEGNLVLHPDIGLEGKGNPVAGKIWGSTAFIIVLAGNGKRQDGRERKQ